MGLLPPHVFMTIELGLVCSSEVSGFPLCGPCIASVCVCVPHRRRCAAPDASTRAIGTTALSGPHLVRHGSGTRPDHILGMQAEVARTNSSDSTMAELGARSTLGPEPAKFEPISTDFPADIDQTRWTPSQLWSDSGQFWPSSGPSPVEIASVVGRDRAALRRGLGTSWARPRR